MNRKSNLYLFLVAIAVMILNGCSGKSTSSPPSTENKDSIEAINNKLKTSVEEIQKKQATPPNIVYIGIDRSGSMKDVGITPTSMSDIEPVLNSLSRTGGTIALGTICDRSNQPLVRQTFPQPPHVNINTVPEMPNEDTNALEYDKELTEYDKKIIPIESQVKKYNENIGKLDRENQERIDALKPQIQKLLEQPQTCQQTDIQGAIRRANVLFAEPQNWSVNPRKFAVFITDGVETLNKKQPVKLNVNKIFLVNGSTESGIFQPLAHERFESPNAAFTTLAASILKLEP